MIKLKRLSHEPVLTPIQNSSWEAGAVFNCAAIYHNDLVHLIYRATDRSPVAKTGYKNSLGYAVSGDGLDFNRLRRPVLEGDSSAEAVGPEDPRIVKLGDTFYMMYTAFDGRDFHIAMAESHNLIQWRRRGKVLDERNKDASLFPEQIGGRYVMFHRRDPDIWLAYSHDMITWTDHCLVMGPLPDSAWESRKIGIAGPPVKTGSGWFLIYHGVSDNFRYCLGAALLDMEDPSQVISRQREPVLAPELEWEKQGHVPDVVFSCGQVEIDDRILLYYAGADTCIGVAELKLDQIDL